MFISYFYKTEDNDWAIGNAQFPNAKISSMEDIISIENEILNNFRKNNIKVDNVKIINFKKF